MAMAFRFGSLPSSVKAVLTLQSASSQAEVFALKPEVQGVAGYRDLGTGYGIVSDQWSCGQPRPNVVSSGASRGVRMAGSGPTPVVSIGFYALSIIPL